LESTVLNRKKIQLIHVSHPRAVIDEHEKHELDDGIERVVGVLFELAHFSVMEMILKNKVFLITDGLNYPLETWVDHVINVLNRCKLVPNDVILKSVKFDNCIVIVYNDEDANDGSKWRWAIKRASTFITQRNGYDCGPIACAKLLKIYGRWPANNKPPGGLRKFVVESFKALLERNDAHFCISVPVIELQDSDEDNALITNAASKSIASDSRNTCMICWSDMEEESQTVKMNCCETTIHAVCIGNWLSSNPTCPFCRQHTSFINFQGSIIPFDQTVNATPTANKSDSNNSSSLRFSNIADASTVKRKRQDVQAGKMTDRRAKFASDTGVSIGAIVRVSNDKRDVQNPRSTIAVVVEVAKAGSVLVFADGGIMVHGTKRKELWVDSDMYEVLARSDEEVVSSILTTELIAVRTEILDGTFDRTKYGTATRNEEQKKFLGISPVKASKGCGCGKTSKLGKTCTMTCACFKSQRGCTSKCYCNGNCLMNTYNNN
jgi:hypothetical protein